MDGFRHEQGAHINNLWCAQVAVIFLPLSVCGGNPEEMAIVLMGNAQEEADPKSDGFPCGFPLSQPEKGTLKKIILQCLSFWRAGFYATTVVSFIVVRSVRAIRRVLALCL